MQALKWRKTALHGHDERSKRLCSLIRFKFQKFPFAEISYTCSAQREISAHARVTDSIRKFPGKQKVRVADWYS